MTNQYTIKKVIITAKVCTDEKKYGFCRIVDEIGDDVFIPAHLIKKMTKDVDDEAIAEIVLNEHDSKTKYRVRNFHEPNGPFKALIKKALANHAEPITQKREPTANDVNQWLLNILEENIGRFLETAAICREVTNRHNYHIESVSGASILDKLHSRGMIAKTQLHNTVENKRAVVTMWHSPRKANETFRHNMGDGDLN